ncbi:MAG: nitroreductase family protein, partial [Pseudomonadota bacterium]
MNDVIHQLTERNSAPKLTEPGPDKITLDYMMQAALRAPDHAWLTPWRFIQLQGDARAALGDVFAEALTRRDPEADAAALDKAKAAPLRAPLLMVVVCR